jgi:hypothetical protein
MVSAGGSSIKKYRTLYLRRDSNPQSQQELGRKPSPLQLYMTTVQEFGAVVCLDPEIWNCRSLDVYGRGAWTGDLRVAAANTDVQ